MNAPRVTLALVLPVTGKVCRDGRLARMRARLAQLFV